MSRIADPDACPAHRAGAALAVAPLALAMMAAPVRAEPVDDLLACLRGTDHVEEEFNACSADFQTACHRAGETLVDYLPQKSCLDAIGARLSESHMQIREARASDPENFKLRSREASIKAETAIAEARCGYLHDMRLDPTQETDSDRVARSVCLATYHAAIYWAVIVHERTGL